METMQKEQLQTIFDREAVLYRDRTYWRIKRVCDVFFSALAMLVLWPFMLLVALIIVIDSPKAGPIFTQIRVGRDGKEFKFYKFRSMHPNAEANLDLLLEHNEMDGPVFKIKNDPRITRVGKFIRKCRLDEVCQLIDVLRGTMTFVGTRPEVPKYVAAYTPEMLATLLLPAGVTSEASIEYKDEAELLDAAADVDAVYIHDVLPGKMRYNLQALKDFSFFSDIKTMFRTVFAVFGG